MALRLVIPPIREPFSLDLVKSHLRVDFADEDAIIQGHISAARRYCEAYQNRALMPQTWELWLDRRPCERYIEIPLPPLQAVEEIKYYDSNDVEHTMPVADYYVDSKSFLGKVVLRNGKSWPAGALRSSNSFVIRFTAGYLAYASIVNTTDTVVQRVSGDAFYTTWSSGKIVTINDATYRLAGVSSSSELLLSKQKAVKVGESYQQPVTSAGKQTNVYFSTNDVPDTVIQAMILHIKMFYDDYSPLERERMEKARDALLAFDRVVTV